MSERFFPNLNLDTDQEAAYLADQNAAVSAGAGSGKTTVLAERYVRLVTQRGLNISEVLTLTFTRKAAAEMYARIFKFLADSPDPRAQERLTQFDQARISTLDSFCTTITKGGSYRYGISGDFRIDETELQQTAAEAAIEVIMRHRRDKAVCRLVAARSFEAVVHNLFADLALTAFSFVKPGTYYAQGQRQIDFIKQETAICCHKITGICRMILAIDDSKSKSNAVQQAQAAVSSRLPLSADFDPAGAAALIETAEFFISPKSFSKPTSRAKDAALVELREAAVALKEEQAPQLFALAQTLLFQEDILLIGKILDEYETLFLERKRVKGLLSFRDTGELAVDILTKDLELRAYYKQHIKAVMIDEFQDNNILQKKLLYLLAEQDNAGISGVIPRAEDLAPDKLFFVGDEKQSIYRFRGADVAVFRGLAQELGKKGKEEELAEREEAGKKERKEELAGKEEAGKTEKISLRTNYRSAPELVDFFNALFPGVFGIPEEDFEAEFSPMRSSPGKPRQAPGSPPRVELFVQEYAAGEEAEDDEAETSKETGEALAAAKRIITGVEQGEFTFGDAAVLFKSTTHQNEYERTFRQAGIPFSAADPRGLFAEGPANDFYAILRLSLFPMDRNAYATVLRSPFVSLGDESVFKIMLENPDESFSPFSTTTSFSPFPSDPPDEWFAHPSERERYDHGRAVFTRLGNLIDLQGLAPVLAYLWYETGYRTYLLYDEDSQPNLEHFEYLYALALEADQRRLTMGAFLDELAPRIGTTSKTETGDIPELKDQVLFITVHKSKGLEFPVVILANTGAADRGERNDKPYFLDPEYGPVINLKSDTAKRKDKAVNYFYNLQRELASRQAEAELKRLFYVAATRAKERLILIGTRNVTKKDQESLVDLDLQGRIEALIKRGRSSSAGELQKKSFLDLFSCGLLGATGPVPSYRLISLAVPNLEKYREEIQQLRKRVALLRQQHGAEASQVSPEAFYALPPCQAPAAPVICTTPSKLENYDALRRPRTGWFDPLPDLKSDAFLNIPDATDDRLSSESRSRIFGTLCHQMIEKLLAGNFLKEDLQKTAYEAVHTLFRGADLSEQAVKTLAEEALELAQRFLDTSLGQEITASPRRRTEFPFILPLQTEKEEKEGKEEKEREKNIPSKPILIRGNMDLICEYQGQCIIVDFKTDRLMNPESHRVQLNCYRTAAKAFSDLPVKTILVYLRNMQAVPLDADLSASELVELAKGAEQQKFAISDPIADLKESPR